MLGTFTSAAGILDIPAPKSAEIGRGKSPFVCPTHSPKKSSPTTRERAGRRWKNPLHVQGRLERWSRLC